jgi:hypothetical protein
MAIRMKQHGSMSQDIGSFTYVNECLSPTMASSVGDMSRTK